MYCSRPKFIQYGLSELRRVMNESRECTMYELKDVMKTNQVDDDVNIKRMSLMDIYHHYLAMCLKRVERIYEQYQIEKTAQLSFVDDMSTKKSGDMIRPQVQAVLDLLVSGIEMDSDFTHR